MSDEDTNDLKQIMERGFWAGERFIPQPQDAARYHEIMEKRAQEMQNAGPRTS